MRRSNLGITLNLTDADPNDPTDPADLDAARRIDGQWNRMFLDPIFLGAYPADLVEDVRDVVRRVAALERDPHGDLEQISRPSTSSA